ncbi:MAG: flagellar biosynthetic protein FliO [Caldimicrobium sp.]|nr:flagellar biosynthetic protein FliO [Caldimicrobium sp.]MCX7613592.1 flagellar biosynthetic protein FliO [Caldimicrobium sp.]MDW8183071.1 flagellar biosynthetic protein FliO [Caldimicrobium sp.]
MDWLSYLQSLGIILLILSSLPLISYLNGRLKNKRQQNSHIKILEIKPIAYKAQLLFVEIEGKKLLIGLSDKGFSFLGELKNDS